MSEITKNRNSAYSLKVHLVFITKYRKPILTEQHHHFMSQCVASLCEDFSAELKGCEGGKDFIHMQFSYQPTMQLSNFVNSVKAVTSRKMRQEFDDLRDSFDKPVLWSRSYFVGSDGEGERLVNEYLRSQRG
ncbi:IS200/IS605 family transposase [Salmonella enterica]|nr:IS200/IS605 family transposase [Salmonella enterica]